MSSRQPWSCRIGCVDATRRVVWDGDQILYEVNAPWGSEQDRGLQPPAGRSGFHWGRVQYTHGGGINRPLEVVRMEYSDSLPEPVGVLPFARWDGAYEGGAVQERCVEMRESYTSRPPPESDARPPDRGIQRPAAQALARSVGLPPF